MTTNVYIHINPLTKKPFYIGIGCMARVYQKKRNKYHTKVVETFMGNVFETRVIYRDIPIEKAWRIEKQIIARCGRICNGTGFLTNIHGGGPLEHTQGKQHWSRGKTMKEIHGEDWVSWRKGKTYEQLFGDKAEEISKRAAENRSKSFKKRLQTKGRTEKEIANTSATAKRRNAKQYTQAELESHKQASLRQKGKTMKERLNDPNYTSSKTGKKITDYIPGWVNPRKGRNHKQEYGSDHIDKRSKPFKIISSLGEQLFENETDFIRKTGSSSPQLIKLRKNGQLKITRKSDSRHPWQNGETIQYFPLSIELFKQQINNFTISVR